MPSQRDNDEERDARIDLFLRKHRARLKPLSAANDSATPKRMARPAECGRSRRADTLR
jgi:hypothetical protein